MTGASRRVLLASALSAVAPGAALAAAAPRVACLDYGLAQTCLALGIVPIALPDPGGYRSWVIEPALPAGVQDLGARTQPNLELLAALRPDAILSVPDDDPALPALRRIAPVLRLPLQGPGPWDLAVAAARAVGTLAGREAAAARLAEEADGKLRAVRAELDAGSTPGPVMVASFLDPRHLAVYGANGIVGAVLDRLGLRNGWTGPTGRWGSATVGLDALGTAEDATLFVIEPVPPDTQAVLRASPLWHALPFVRGNRVRTLPPVLMFGSLPAAVRLAELLAADLSGPARA